MDWATLRSWSRNAMPTEISLVIQVVKDGRSSLLGGFPGLQDLHQQPPHQPAQEKIPGDKGIFVLPVGKIDHSPKFISREGMTMKLLVW